MLNSAWRSFSSCCSLDFFLSSRNSFNLSAVNANVIRRKQKTRVHQPSESVIVSFDWTSKLKEKCDEFDIEYFTSPYDYESVNYYKEALYVTI